MDLLQVLSISRYTRKIRAIYCSLKNPKLKKLIFDYYKDNQNEEIEKVVKFEKTHFGVYFLPYKFVDEYKARKINVYKDISGLFYVINENGDKLFFPKKFKYKNSVKSVYLGMLAEQDYNSPHRYFGREDIKKGIIMFDVGAAEASYSLSLIHSLKKLVVFECDEEWIEALNYTFKPFMDKVEIIKKYVSSETTEYSITIDDFCDKRKEYPDYIKMDIEGAEENAITGAQRIIEEGRCTYWSICTYHRQDSEAQIKQKFSSKYEYTTSEGYTICTMGGIEKPYLRRGVLKIKIKE